MYARQNSNSIPLIANDAALGPFGPDCQPILATLQTYRHRERMRNRQRTGERARERERARASERASEREKESFKDGYDCTPRLY